MQLQQSLLVFIAKFRSYRQIMICSRSGASQELATISMARSLLYCIVKTELYNVIANSPAVDFKRKGYQHAICIICFISHFQVHDMTSVNVV